MKKRLLSKVIAITLLFVLALTGCKKSVGTQEDNAAPIETEEEEEDYFKFGFSGIDMENPYFITLEKAIREVIEDEEAIMITKDPASDPELQAQQIEESQHIIRADDIGFHRFQGKELAGRHLL